MSSKYAEKWPVPPPSEQPPKKPLRARRRDAREYECGLMLSAPMGSNNKQTYSMLPRDFPEHFNLHNAGEGFVDPVFDDSNTWVQMRLDVPICSAFVDKKHLHDDLPIPKLRPTEAGPMLSVFHTLDVVLTCTYDAAEGDAETEPAMDELRLTLPLSFVRVPRRNTHIPIIPIVDLLSTPAADATYTAALAEACPIDMRQAAFPPASLPYAQALPAYNQLYYSNGTLREDPTPLPRYTRDPKDAEDPPPPPVVCKQVPPTKLPLSPVAPSELDSPI